MAGDRLATIISRRCSAFSTAPNRITPNSAGARVVEVHAHIHGAGLERGIAFFWYGLNLTLRRRLSPGWVDPAGANLAIFLLGNHKPTANLGATQIQRDFTRHWTPVHLDFIVPELDAAVARLTGLGATLDRPIRLAE